MTTIKSYTDIEQSKKLTEILPLESADMYYCYGMDIYTKKWDYDITPTIIDESNQIDIGDIPCWSLAALLDVLKYPSLTQDVENKWFITDWTGGNPKSEHGFDSPVDACYEMIVKLHEQELL